MFQLPGMENLPMTMHKQDRLFFFLVNEVVKVDNSGKLPSCTLRGEEGLPLSLEDPS